ncbi:hypothetical protein [Clostridium perfringens]|uniref:hypothetical protein n=1 Tax=Clostridium perfringens TaxID=1502 RepID=UPI001B8457F1|nr:hypothetical protein [Clostridium perfringens]HBC2035116.1 hypothetical protein [Clostridium perfringens]HBC2058260.1 hypothetical protein [Clostridium perfringens]HBC2072470.1 hypothetical protein [Clostridium perfringens]
MSKIEKHYKLTQSEIDYIELVKEKNDLTYSTEALSLIIREHKKGIENDFVTTETYKNVLAIMELINSYYFLNGLEEAILYPRGGETNVECIDKALKKAEKKFEEEKVWQKFKNKKIKISFED